jgi:hypothetical protein
VKPFVQRKGKLMNYRKKLIDFMKLKASFLSPKFAKSYMTKKDTKDVMKWSEDDARYVYNLILEQLDSLENKIIPCVNDTDICIFCLYHLKNVSEFFDKCGFCTYGKRHGICANHDSLYYKIISQNTTLSDIVEDFLPRFIEVLTKDDDNEEIEITKINQT